MTMWLKLALLIMSNVYFIDTGDHNWNTVANWFSTIGSGCCCCCHTAYPLGRLPSAADGDSVYIASGKITTGPTGGYSGSVSLTPFSNVQGGTPSQPLTLAAGVYSGTIALYGNSASGIYGPSTISGGTYSNAITVIGNSNLSLGPTNIITGGTFTAASSVNLIEGKLQISGGSFSGKFEWNYAGSGALSFYEITGGTYTPTISVTVSGGTFPANEIPWDPGFSQNQLSNYNPTIVVSGASSDLLQTGLPT